MINLWPLREAKNRLSEVIDKALREGPQQITKRGKAAAVILSPNDYERLKHHYEDPTHFLRRAPLRNVDLDRNRDIPRNVAEIPS